MNINLKENKIIDADQMVIRRKG